MAGDEVQLHWLRANDLHAVDGNTIRQGKDVVMQSEHWKQRPERFTIEADRSWLARLAARLGGRHRAIPPFDAEVIDAQTSVSRSKPPPWVSGTMHPKQDSIYTFTDGTKSHRSGPLRVTLMDWMVGLSGAKVEGKAAAKIPGSGLELSSGSEFTKGTIIHRALTPTDPELRLVLMLPWLNGESDLMGFVREYLSSIDGLTGKKFDDTELKAASDGFLRTDPQGWEVWLDTGGTDAKVSLSANDQVDIEVGFQGKGDKFAYALRISETSDPEQYVVSEVATVERREGSVAVDT